MADPIMLKLYEVESLHKDLLNESRTLSAAFWSALSKIDYEDESRLGRAAQALEHFDNLVAELWDKAG